jgi:hypothetical protein
MALRFSLREVRAVRPEFNLTRGLLQSKLLPWAPVAVDSSRLYESVRREAPADGVEVVEWMIYSASDNAVFTAWEDEYSRAGSRVATGSGDAYIPGVRVEDVRGESVRGSVVAERGYGVVVTPAGGFRVPARGKALIASGDVLAWASIPYVSFVQWVLTLVRWLELAKVPIRERVRFPASHGLVAPNMFHVPATLSPVRLFRVGLTSSRRQVVAVKGRGTRGSYEKVLFTAEVEVPEGESEVIFNVLGVPFVQAFTLEIQPEDGTETVLDYIDTLPP